jgi:protein-S-isoprenylcysteine O-methyltransferase Ste14
MMGKLLDWPPLWLAGFLGAVWALGGVGAVFGKLGSGLGFGLGLGLIGAGLALMLAAVWQMARARTTVVPRRDASQLVTAGVFALSRNPIYLGDVLILLGACFVWDAPLGLFAVPLFAWVIQRRFILGEEAALFALFGKEYAIWAGRVRRWV